MAEPPRVRDERLIEAGIRLFGQRGLDGVGTRAIAEAAGRPMSTITYQFGGKEGLYLACAEHIAATIGNMIGQVADDHDAATPMAARAQIVDMVRVLTHTMLQKETADLARFVVREQQDPSSAFDVIYGSALGQFLEKLAQLLQIIAIQKMTAAQARILAMTIMGQGIAFRISRAAMLRLTEWNTVGDEEARVIDDAIQNNLSAILDRLEQRQHA